MLSLSSARALLRASARLQSSRPQLTSTLANTSSTLSQWQCRTYASKSKGKGKEKEKEKDKASTRNKASSIPDREAGARGPHATSSSKLVPGSQQVLAGEAQAEFEKADAKMKSAVEWFRRECAAMEMQGSGRVTPDVLKPVRVMLPENEGVACGLNEVATVGVRDGTTILVTVFAENTLKHVEKAIYAADIPHVVPQKLDNRTIKIPMPKPTIESRNSLYKNAAKVAEDTRVQLRRQEQTSVKKGKYEKRSIEVEEFHELLLRHLKVVDAILVDLKANLGISGK